MAAEKLIMSTLSLSDGDSFILKFNAPAPFEPTYVLNIVSGSPTGFEILFTENITNPDQVAPTAAANLAEGLRKIPIVTSVVIEDTILTIVFASGNQLHVPTLIADLDTSNGSDLVFVKAIDLNGTVTNFSSPFVSNITVTDIEFNSLTFTGISSSKYLAGVKNEKIKASIFFTTKDVIAIQKTINFKFGLTSNESDVYASGSNVGGGFTVDESFFDSRLTGQMQAYRGTVSALEPSPPKGFETGGVTITSLGGNDYRLDHEFELYLLNVDDINGTSTGLIIPDELNGDGSIKYVYEVNIFAGPTTPLPDETTTKQDLTNFFPNGTVGWLQETYNQGITRFQLDTFAFETPDGELNTAFDSSATAQVSALVNNFAVTHKVVIQIEDVTDDLDPQLNATANKNIARVELLADGVPVSLGNLINVSATINADPSKLDILFTVKANEYFDLYSISVIINETVLGAAQNTLDLKTGVVSSLGDDSVLDFGTYPGAVRTEFNLNPHYSQTVSISFNEVKGFTEDFITNRFRVVNTDTVNTTLDKFILSIQSLSTGEVLERRVINAQALPYIEVRDFNLDATDTTFTTIDVQENGTGIYDFIYPFQIWKNWFSVPNLVFRLEGVFSQTLITNDVVKVRVIRSSPDFQIGNYDETKNTVSEPQALRKPPSIQYFVQPSGQEVKSINNSSKTKIVLTFEDNNLNDLEVVPIAPFVYDVAQVNGLTAYMGINVKTGSQSDYIRFHAHRINSTNSPWEIITGHPSFHATLTRTDIKTATLEAIIDPDKIRSIYGDDIECLTASGRLDAFRIPENCFVYETIFHITEFAGPVNDGAYGGIGHQTGFGAALGDWEFRDGTQFFGVASVNILDDSSLQINELNGVQQPVKYCGDLAAVTTLIFVNNKTIGNFNLSDFTALTFFELKQQDQVILLTMPTHSIATVDMDIANSIGIATFDLSGLLNLSGTVDGSNASALTSLLMPNIGHIGAITDIDFSSAISLNNVNLTDVRLGGRVEFNLCTSLVNFTTGSSPDLITIWNMDDSAITGPHDLSGYNLAGAIRIKQTNITSVTLPSTSNVISLLRFDNADLTGTLDLTPLTGLEGILHIQSNPNLTIINFPISAGVTSQILGFSNTSLTTVDLSGMSGVGGVLQFNSCSALTSFITGSSSQVINSLFLNSCANLNIELNLSGYTAIQGTIWGNNTKITNVLLPVTTGIVNDFDFSTALLDVNLDMSNLANMAGSVKFSGNPFLPSFTLPASSGIFTLIKGNNCPLLTSADITPLAGTNDGITLDFDSCAFNSGAMDTLLVDLVVKTWVNGFVDLANQSPVAVLGAAGLAAKATLELDGWVVNV